MAVETGKISKWVDEKGYGFIENTQGESIFLHINQWKKNNSTQPIVGLSVEFQTQKGQKGKEAILIKNLPQQQITDTNDYSNPYHFVAVDTKNTIIDTPVWHDGKNSNDLLSGEMRFTLTALTPLLVGQYQYKAGEVKNTVHENEGIQLPFFNQPVNDDKAILEPLRLTDGRVVLSGTSLKGMLRHSLSGLLSPPMERVAERSYSYRPNATFQEDEHFRKVRPAIIVKADENEIKIKLLNDARVAWFGHKIDLGNPNFTGKAKDWIGIIKEPRKKKKDKQGNILNDKNGEPILQAQKYRFINGTRGESLGRCYFAYYVGGIDGKAILCKAFNKNSGVYDAVLIQENEYEHPKTEEEINKLPSIPKSVIEHHLKTFDYLSSNEGLLASGYPNGTEKQLKEASNAIKALKKSWQENRSALVGQLIYVELENGQINSFGHHYYYRWRYANTIRTIMTKDGTTGFRPALVPLKSSQNPLQSERGFTDENGRPHCLSAARLLFGYTSRTEDPLKQDGTANIGTGVYQRLAGRIHINSAVEVEPDGKNDQRFLTGNQALALQPLGQPRPSSVEHYLQQPLAQIRTGRKGDGGQMLTYGDLLGRDSAGLLAGRKFYLHQPEAANIRDKSCYEAETGADYIHSNQALLARFISKPQTTFKFRLQFKDLRSWELGALLVTLEPNKYLLPVLKQLSQAENLASEIENYRNPSPLFAHKLGHARPLGFGSVNLQCDKLQVLAVENNLPNMQAINTKKIDEALSALAEKLQTMPVESIKQWCAVHQYAGRTRAAYRKLNGEIFDFHSKARTEHIKHRRLAVPENEEEKRRFKISEQLLKPLDFKIE